MLQMFKSQQEVKRTPTTSPSTSSTTSHLNDVFIKRFVGRLVTQLGWLEDTQDQRISMHHRRQSKNLSARHKRLRGKCAYIFVSVLNKFAKFFSVRSEMPKAHTFPLVSNENE
jgi:hypothetical protein